MKTATNILFMSLLASCSSYNNHQDLLPMAEYKDPKKVEVLLSESEEAEYQYLADIYGLSEEKLGLKGDTKVVQTKEDWDIQKIDLNEIEDSSFVINDYEVVFIEDKFKHEAQLVAEAKAEKKRGSRSIASVEPVNMLHKKRRVPNLHSMALKSTPESIKYLAMKEQQQLNKVNKAGDTPLHIAIKNRRFDNVRALLSLNANPNIPDAKGKTVADYAKEYEAKSILKLLNK